MIALGQSVFPGRAVSISNPESVTLARLGVFIISPTGGCLRRSGGLKEWSQLQAIQGCLSFARASEWKGVSRKTFSRPLNGFFLTTQLCLAKEKPLYICRKKKKNRAYTFSVLESIQFGHLQIVFLIQLLLWFSGVVIAVTDNSPPKSLN